MKSKKNVLFTFDYELFLGQLSGTVEKCILQPTNTLVDIFDQYGVKAIFFIDTTYLCRLQKAATNYEKANEDFNRIVDQIGRLVDKGHYVFPHIHPHWLDAIYHEQNNQWSLTNLSKYRFHNISEEDRHIVFKDSIHILNNITSSINPLYRIDGFRAGGWCIQPFVDFKPFFEEYGIKYDFSVLKGQRSHTTAQYYDFIESPAADIYSFDNDVIKPGPGQFQQFTISSIDIPLAFKFVNIFFAKYLWKINNRSIGDGFSVSPSKVEGKTEENTPVKVLNKEMISFELLNRVKLKLYTEYLRSNDYMHFISHPKMLSSHNFRMASKFLQIANSKYNIETDFRKM